MDLGTYGNPTPAEKKIDSYYDVPEGVDIRGRYDEEFAKILTKDALKFVADLQREFRNHIKYALECRREAKRRHIREHEWVCAPVPPAVADRKVEITGPVDRKMIINALNSGAKAFMADFEDALSPSWENLMRGQVNLRDAVAGTISFHDKVRNRVYKLNDQTAKLFVRVRGWHLPEAHILIDGEPATGCLVDFGLYFYHNHSTFRRTQGAGFGPFFYLPKMEHSREAKIWNSVFEKAENVAGIERGSIRATVLIETLPAVYVKTFRAHPDRLLPDRVQVGMTQHFMKSYSDLLIRTCHRRGVHAMGGMAAQIPIKDDPVANEAALELVRKDKLREVKAGHDGSWAAHPGLVPACMEVFDNNIGNAPNQIKTAKREDAANITEQDLLQIPIGGRSMEGLRLNTRVGIQYMAAWLDIYIYMYICICNPIKKALCFQSYKQYLFCVIYILYIYCCTNI
uniref:malate synthase n=1 Tax=Cajanus cajan TaxID=3821 RepID=A0A151TE75_CAJCA|nr:Malate synthase, glyoxysomal [Cajanus cajan]